MAARRHAHPLLQPHQAQQTARLHSGSRALLGPVRAQLAGPSPMRAALVQAGSRLLGNLRMLRAL